MTIPTTRKEAILSGSNVYRTGVSCINAHDANRYVAGGACSECKKITERKRYGQLKKSSATQKNNAAIIAERELDRAVEAHHEQITRAVAEGRVLYGHILDEPTPASRAHCRRVREEGATP